MMDKKLSVLEKQQLLNIKSPQLTFLQEDFYGDFYDYFLDFLKFEQVRRQKLKSYGVSLDYVNVTPGKNTGHAYLTLDAQGQNEIISTIAAGRSKKKKISKKQDHYLVLLFLLSSVMIEICSWKG